MGQLERYGLYVLCVVIVLILGVAIWGGGAPLNAGEKNPELNRPLVSNEAVVPPSTAVRPATSEPGAANRGVAPEEAFFASVTNPAPTSASLSVDAELLGIESVESARRTSAKPKSGRKSKSSEAKADELRALRTYTVKKGDTMEKVARRVLGSIRHVSTIKKLNPSVDPRRMRPGEVLKLPWVEGESKGSGPNMLAKKSEWRDYTVKTGDSAYAISIAMYGTAKHAKAILEANDITDAKKIRPKTVIKIPPLK